MNYSHYIGIDVSKEKLDVVLMTVSGEILDKTVIKNNVTAIGKWLRSLFKKHSKEEMLFCLEPTGHYSNVSVITIHKAGAKVWIANPVDIRQSIGMQRGKNDAIDARRIAEYARRFKDKARLVQSKELQLLKLKQLLAYREELVTERAKFRAQVKDFKGRFEKEVYLTIQRTNQGLITQLNKYIGIVEEQIEKMIREVQEMKERYDLVQTVTGVGKILARTVIAMTSDFSRFNNARALACHAGVAPFHYASGSSIRGRNKISHRANKRLKTLLHLAALSAIRTGGDLKNYYERKVKEGKPKMLVLNAVRNKIISRIFAVIKRATPYQINLEIS